MASIFLLHLIAFDSKNKILIVLDHVESTKKMACKLHNKMICDYVNTQQVSLVNEVRHIFCNFLGLNNEKKDTQEKSYLCITMKETWVFQ